MREHLIEQHAGNRQFLLAFKLLNELSKLGLTQVVISPGSRSTPLVLAAIAHPTIQQTVIIDERSAAFFALGYARVNREPIALICTSGTAAAHYFPAVIESSLQHVPIIAFTADRPISLRNSGANQTINQDRLFGEYAHFCTLNIHQATEESFASELDHLKELIYKGAPIQCNVHLEKPLEPELHYFEAFKEKRAKPTKLVAEPNFHFLNERTSIPEEWLTKIAKAKRPVFIAGPSNIPANFEAIYHQFSKQAIPIVAEKSSGYSLLTAKIPTASNAFSFLSNDALRQKLQPDLIISCGQSSTHKSTLSWLAELANVPQIHFNGYLKDVQNGLLKKPFLPILGMLEPSQLSKLVFPNCDAAWIELWSKAELKASQKKATLLENEIEMNITEPSFYYFLTKLDRKTLHWCLGNSLVARDYDVFKYDDHQHLGQLFTTRGASGIDGLIAQAAGTAKITKEPVGLILGDVSFQHDLGSLEILAKNPEIKLQIYVINNQGGRIFDRLPIRTFETVLPRYYHTKAASSIQEIAASFSLSYSKITTNKQLKAQLNQAFTGSQICEIIVDLPQSELIRNLYQS